MLLHGAVSDSRVWRLQLDSFADAFTVVAWDAPGCGASDDRDDFTMGDFAESLAGLIAALQLEPAHVLGHSWGSSLALELYRRHPEIVRSLVLVGAYAGWAGSLPADEVSKRLAFALSVAAQGRGGFEPRSMPGLFSEAMSPERTEELVTIMSEIRPSGTRAMALALAETDQRDMLATVDVSTLLVYGDADERSPLSVARQIHASIPGSTLEVLPGLGHECYLEDPRAFESVVRAFLSGT